MQLMKEKAGIVSWMVLAFLLYFLSEGLLRQATISNINPQNIDLNGLVLKLPSSIRDTVNENIEAKRLRNSLKDAETDSEKVLALLGLADRSKDSGQKTWLYREIFAEYPNTPETYLAYQAFLLNDDEQMMVTIEDYQGFLKRFSQLEAYNIWVAGANRISTLKPASPNILFKFLSPLLASNPNYREYGNLYLQIAKLAEKLGDKDAAKLANTLAGQCKSLPGLEESLRRKLDAEEKAKAKAAKTLKNSGKGG